LKEVYGSIKLAQLDLPDPAADGAFERLREDLKTQWNRRGISRYPYQVSAARAVNVAGRDTPTVSEV
jgi:hypothetical protein